MQFRQRRYFPFPGWNHGASDVTTAALEAQKAWHKAWTHDAFAPSVMPESVSPHPLAEASRALPFARSRNSAAEEEAILIFAPRLPAVLEEADAVAFISLIEDMATTLVGAHQTLRRVPVATDPDRDGARILFPRSGTLHGRMTRLHRYLRDSDGPPIFLATVALVALTNAHPFTDGNGRTGRLLFNLILNRDQEDGMLAAVPLHDLGNRPPGNLTLHMRAAELHGEWGSLMRFLSAAIAAGGMRSWGSAGARRGEGA